MASYEDRIRAARPRLSPSLKRLADYLLDSYIEAAFLTATELAHALDIDPATVVRFSQRVGYPGYPELQREIRAKVRRELLPHREPGDESPAAAADAALAEVVRHLEMVRRSFPFEAAEKLLATLDQAERIVVIAEGPGRPPAQTLADWLEAAGYSVQLVGSAPADLARALAGARKGDLMLALQVVEETPFAARAMAAAAEAGLTTAALVAAPSMEVARHAQVLLAAYASPEPGLGQVAMVAAVYALIHMLTHARPGRFQSAATRMNGQLKTLMTEAAPPERRGGRPRKA